MIPKQKEMTNIELAETIRDLADAVDGLYGFLSLMFDIRWPHSDPFNKGKASLDEVMSRMDSHKIFSKGVREWMKKLREEEDGKGDRE